MAQIIKHRRGSLESLSAATSSFQKGELIIISGSSNITSLNGAGMVFAAVESGSVQAVNRFIIGDNAPNVFPANTYNGLLKGVPYYASGSSTLYLLGSGGNDAINLVGNIQPFSQSVATSINALSQSIGSGTIGSSVTQLNAFTASATIRLNNLESTSASVNGHISDINAYTASNDTTNTLQTTRINQLAAGTASVNTFTQSVDGHISDINTKTGSFETKFSTLGTYTASVDTKFGAIGTYTSSLITAFTASGANVTFNGDTTVKGNLFVQGTQTIVDSTTVNISDNILVLNAAGTSDGGIQVRDAVGGSTTSGSLLWDVTNDYWKAGKSGSESQILVVNGMGVVSGSSQINFTQLSGISANIISSSSDTAQVDMIIDGGSISANLKGGVVSGSSQITISDTTGYSTFSSSIATNVVELFSTASDHESRLDTIESSVGGGGSVSTRIDQLAAATASVNSFTASATIRLNNLESTSASVIDRLNQLSTDSGSQNTRITTLESKATTLATYTASVDGHISDINTWSASVKGHISDINTWSGSAKTSITDLQTKATTLQTYTASVNGHIEDINAYTSSNDTTNTAQNNRLSNLESTSASVNTSITSINGHIADINTKTGSFETKFSTLQTYTASIDTKFTSVGSITASLISTASNHETRVIALESTASYLQGTFSTSVDSRLDSIESSIGGGGALSTRVSSLESFSGSQEAKDVIISAYTASMNTFTASVNGHISNINSWSASINGHIADMDAYTASNDIVQVVQDDRLNNLELTSASVLGHISDINTKTGSFETKFSTLQTYTASVDSKFSEIHTYTASLRQALTASGANITFSGNVTIPGNLTVAGTQTIVDSTTIQLGDNILELNGTGATNGGIHVRDTTNPNTLTGSLVWDSTSDYWVAGTKNSESKILLAGGDNVISSSAQIIGILSSLNTYTGSNDTTNTAQNNRLNNLETTSASVNISVSEINSWSASVKGHIVDINSYTASNDTTNTAQNNRLNNLESTSASVNVHITDINAWSASVRGHIVDINSYTGSNDTLNSLQTTRIDQLAAGTGSVNSFTSSINTTIKTKLDVEGVISGSSQLTSSYDTRYVISGSITQTTWDNIASKPGGIVSGSVQVDITQTTGFTTFSSSIETRISLIDGGTY